MAWTHRRIFWALLLLGLLVRIAFAGEVLSKRTGLHRAHPRDMWLYYAEADLVAAGDWQLRGTPALLAKHQREGLGAATYLVSKLGSDHFHEVFGESPLIHAPGYPWLLAATRVVDDSGYLLRSIQILATLLLAVLTRWLARRVTGSERVALFAFALVLLHPTTVFYAAFLLRATWISLLILGLLISLTRLYERPRWTAAVACGVLLGALHMTKAMTPIVLLVLMASALSTGLWRRLRFRHLLVGAAAFLITVSPLILRNVLCGSPPLHTGSNAHTAIVIYSFEGADGLHLVRPSVDYLHSVVTKGEGSLLRTLAAAYETHPSVGSVVNLTLRKLQGFWNAYEARNNLSIYEYQPWLWSLALFPASALVLFPLALLGCARGARRWRRLWALFAGVGISLVFCMAAAPQARYRLPAVPFLAIFAAIGIESLLFRLRRGRRLLGSLALLTLFVGLCHPAALSLTAKPGFPPTRSPDRISSLRSLSDQYALQGEVRSAALLALRSLDELPAMRQPRPALNEALILHVAWTYARCEAARDPALSAAALALAERVSPKLRARLEER